MTTKSIETATHCAYCGRPIPGDADAPERFGKRSCTDVHAEEYVKEVRAQKLRTVAPEPHRDDRPPRRECC